MALEDAQVEDEEQEGDGDAGGKALPAAEPDEASLEELIAEKSEKRKDGDEDSEDEGSLLTVDREERTGGSLPGRVTPQQATEFVCRSCFLVKHQSQLANKKRMLCKDCA